MFNRFFLANIQKRKIVRNLKKKKCARMYENGDWLLFLKTKYLNTCNILLTSEFFKFSSSSAGMRWTIQVVATVTVYLIMDEWIQVYHKYTRASFFCPYYHWLQHFGSTLYSDMGWNVGVKVVSEKMKIHKHPTEGGYIVN